MISPKEKERLERLEADATRAFSRHQIVAHGVRNGRPSDSEPETGLGWWVIRRAYADGTPDSAFWTEIIEGHGGYLYINGDIDAAVFGRFYPTPHAPGQMVRWMCRRSANDLYFAEKMHIGMSAELEREYDSEFAVMDFDEWLRERSDDGDFSLSNAFDRDDAESMRRGILDGESMGSLLDTYGFSVEPETWSRWGMVVSTRAVFAWAALRRLCELLDQAHETNGSKSP